MGDREGQRVIGCGLEFRLELDERERVEVAAVNQEWPY